MSSARDLYLGIDLGGTNIKAGVVDDEGHPLADVKIPTEASGGPEHGTDRIVCAAQSVLEEAGIGVEHLRGVGLASPGPMDLKAGTLIHPPNLPGWHAFPIREAVSKKLGVDVVFQNDAAAAAYGEFWAGAGSAADSLVLWTLGTGVGSGIIYEDKIIEGAHSYAGECGHMIIQMDGGRMCIGTGQYGTVEAYSSARSLTLAATTAIEHGASELLRTWVVDEGRNLTPILIGEAAAAGDDLAHRLVMEVARCLGVATVNLLHVLNPEMVAIGGAMTFGRKTTPLGRAFLDQVMQTVRERAFALPAERTKIDYAELGGDAGFIGAAGCARQKVREASS